MSGEDARGFISTSEIVFDFFEFEDSTSSGGELITLSGPLLLPPSLLSSEPTES